MSYIKYLLILIFNLFLIISAAQARWGSYEDAPIEYKFLNKKININKDGTYEKEVEFYVKILKESGREKFAQKVLTYHEDISHIDILEAKTIYNDTEYAVTKDMIEDKSLASSVQGFDQARQIAISFPKVELGSEIYLKYKYIEKKVTIDNFYGDIFRLNTDGYLHSMNTQITSKLPLQMKVNDPRKILNVIKETKEEVDFIDITLKNPVYEHLVNEPENGLLNLKHITWVSLSSLGKWEDLVNRLATRYYQVINQPLPEVFKFIKESAENKDNDEEKINIVTSALNEKIQYMGDWRTVEGRYFPRDLEKIASSQMGDCKDFTASTASILQALDYKVQPILVMRGVYNISNPDALPCLGNFNHVMLKVTNKNKKVYWIDPTNMVSMAGGIFPDIADKIALVLDNQEPGYTKIPTIAANNAKVIINKELSIHNNIIDEDGKIILQREVTLNLAGLGLNYSNAQLKDFIFRIISGTHLNDDEKKFLELPDLTSRIVKDLKITYALQQKNKIFKTNLGSAIHVGYNSFFKDITDTVPDQLSDIYIGIPETREKHTIIKDIEVKNCNKLNLEIKSPWVDVNRSCKYQNNSTEFIDIFLIKKSFITNEELKTKEYKNLKRNLENNFEGASIIINNEIN